MKHRESTIYILQEINEYSLCGRTMVILVEDINKKVKLPPQDFRGEFYFSGAKVPVDSKIPFIILLQKQL